MGFNLEGGKALIQTKTFWGVVVAVIGLVLPHFSTLLSDSVDDIISGIGLVIALIGRFTATKEVTGVVFK